MIKSLVTGGAGFIGSHVVDLLLLNGHEVIAIDDESSDAHDKFYWNDLSRNHVLDICNYDDIEPLFEGVDYVFHLAAESRIMNTIDNPSKAVKTNAFGTTNILQAARKHEVKKVIYSSTSSVYGLNKEVPQSENLPINCLNPYSVSKYAGEELCRMYSDLFNVDTVCLRYFNVYGERQPKKGPYAPVVGIFQRQISNGEIMTVVGDGLQRRDFVHVSDVARANLTAALSDKNIKVPINIGTGKNYSVLDIARMFDGPLRFIPDRPGEARETLADISNAEFYLNWHPTIDLETWIKENK